MSVGDTGKCFYSLAQKIHGFLRGRLSIPIGISEEKIGNLQKLNPARSRDELLKEYDCQRIQTIIGILVIFCVLVLLAMLSQHTSGLFREGRVLLRGEPGAGTESVTLQVAGAGEKKEITLEIPERQYRPEEEKAKFAQAREYILKHFLGENESDEKVTKALNLVSQIPDSSIKVSWKLDRDGYVREDGSINNGSLKEKQQIELTAVLSYLEQKEKIPISCVIMPKEKTVREKFWEDWEAAMEESRLQSVQENQWILPEDVEGEKVSYRETKKSRWHIVLLIGIILCLFVPFFMDCQTEQRLQRRKRQLQREYPEMIERFILLIGAGMTVRGAWYRITDDYEKKREAHGMEFNYLYEEMLITRYEMENGRDEVTAYSAFGRRISLLQYMKFSTLLCQNLKKGTDDLLKRMDMEVADALRERRELAKQLGEEAGTKLLLPMMLMLGVVFALILLAAFQQM